MRVEQRLERWRSLLPGLQDSLSQRLIGIHHLQARNLLLRLSATWSALLHLRSVYHSSWRLSAHVTDESCHPSDPDEVSPLTYPKFALHVRQHEGLILRSDESCLAPRNTLLPRTLGRMVQHQCPLSALLTTKISPSLLPTWQF